VLALLEEGHSVVIVDDLSNSFPRVFEHMKKLAGDKKDKMKFEQVGLTTGPLNICLASIGRSMQAIARSGAAYAETAAALATTLPRAPRGAQELNLPRAVPHIVLHDP
jgi:hypothetical protein